MSKTKYFIVAGLVAGAATLVLADDEGSLLSDRWPSKMKEKVVEARAKKHEDTDGVAASGRKYIYVDQKGIDAATEGLRSSSGGQDGNDRELNIGATTLRRGDGVRSVDIVIKADKKIDVKTNGKPTNVNLGMVNAEDGALKNRNVKANIIVDAEKGIKVH